MVSRMDVRTVRCPRCGASAGLRCWGKPRRGEAYMRTANHAERIAAYEAVLRER